MACGYVIRGDSDEDLLAGAHQHMDEVHPDLAERPSDEDLLASAQEE
jgi:predicted small metal-binding protein